MFLKSTVDWCEQNYSVSSYIAEYWNTLTGLCIIFSGVYFERWRVIYINEALHKYNDNFVRICTLLILVGVGTMLFHGTLYYPFQLLDELPMLLLANEYTKLLLSLEVTKESIDNVKYKKLTNIVFYSYRLLPIIVLSYFIDHRLQIITFHLTLKMCEGSVLYLLYNLSQNLNRIVYSHIYKKHESLKLQRRSNKISRQITLGSSVFNLGTSTSFINRRHISSNNDNSIVKETLLLHIMQSRIKVYLDLRSELKHLSKVSIYIYGSSILIWCLENLFCKYVQPFQFHAIWHVLSSIGIYHLNKIMQLHTRIDCFTYIDDTS